MSFIYAKQKNLPKLKRPRVAGDLWTWIAFCPDTKLVPTWRVGDRTVETATDFLADMESRLVDRIQLTTDGYSAYLEAVAAAFGDEVDYAMLSKVASREELEIRKEVISGDPDEDHISTSLIERQNLTLRMSSRRYTRKTNAFSKKMENHALAVALHFLHYNFVRIHSTIRMTPAMAAGVTDRLYDLDWILDMADEAWSKPNRPKTYQRKNGLMTKDTDFPRYKIDSMYLESVPDDPEMVALVFRYDQGASTSYIATREKMIKDLSDVLEKLKGEDCQEPTEENK